ncbi:MAG: GNAT family N-acetyltransferase [Christensenellales bacterium]
MEDIMLVSPAKEHEAQMLGYKKEFEENGDSMDGSAMLHQMDDYGAWLALLSDNAKEETVQAGLVPSSAYLAVRKCDGRVVGMIHIRHRLNDYLYRLGGHIGYSVRKSERQKGYAKAMLGLALQKCRALGLEKVLVTCYKTNAASIKTILAHGGVLENEVSDKGETPTQRYWITLG